MEVRLDELKDIVVKLLDEMKAADVDTVDIPFDFYWSIPKASRYSPYEEPKDLTMGQLSDDWRELQRIANDETPAISYGLVWLGAVLQAIGETKVG